MLAYNGAASRNMRIPYRTLTQSEVGPRSDAYRVNDLLKTVQVWQPAVISRYASSSNPKEPARGGADCCMRARGEKMHCGAMSLAA